MHLNWPRVIIRMDRKKENRDKTRLKFSFSYLCSNNNQYVAPPYYIAQIAILMGYFVFIGSFSFLFYFVRAVSEQNKQNKQIVEPENGEPRKRGGGEKERQAYRYCFMKRNLHKF